MDRHWRRLRLGIVVGDVVAVVAAYRVVSGLRVLSGNVSVGGLAFSSYNIVTSGMVAVILVLGWALGAYRREALLGGNRVYPLLLAVATYAVVVRMVLGVVLATSPLVSRSWLLASWVASVVFLSASRLLWRQVGLAWQRSGKLARRVLIAGANQQGIAVAQQLRDQARHGSQLLGFLDDYQRPGTEVISGVHVVGHPSAVLQVARALKADEVIIIAGGLSWESQRLLAELVTRPDAPIEAHISPTFYDLLTTSADLSHIAYVPIITLHRARLSGVNALVKALVDMVLSGVLLLILSPAFAFWRVRAWMLGVPMLYQVPVLGFAGQTFDVVGLNSRLVRSPVLARLPALWNVFCRDLSLVGPRPIRAQELPVHERWLANFFAMRPGLSGLWRIRPGQATTEERVALDLFYIRNYTLSLDVQILLTTSRQLARRAFGMKYELGRWLSVASPTNAQSARRETVAVPTALPAMPFAPPLRSHAGDAEVRS
jgi:lipopolysaccharide/colanic/teichoic acid biosynthesis glycosyltransferase/nucleotide-binding universal stress UspA family protein